VRYRRALQLRATGAIAEEDLQEAKLNWLKSRAAAITPSFRYERPAFEYDRTLFTDLVQYAPGLSTSDADILATLETEADVEAPKVGSIDAVARQLIDKARAADWVALTIAAQRPLP